MNNALPSLVALLYWFMIVRVFYVRSTYLPEEFTGHVAGTLAVRRLDATQVLWLTVCRDFSVVSGFIRGCRAPSFVEYTIDLTGDDLNARDSPQSNVATNQESVLPHRK